MRCILVLIRFPVTRFNWTLKIWFFLLRRCSGGREMFDAVLHNKSLTNRNLPDVYDVLPNEGGIVTFIDFNRLERQAIMKTTSNRHDQLLLWGIFEDECEVTAIVVAIDVCLFVVVFTCASCGLHG